MARKTLQARGFAEKGLNTDLAPWDLPEGFLTDVLNVRITGNTLRAFGGYLTEQILPDGVEPGFLMAVPTSGANYWLIAAQNSVWAYDGSAFTDISNPEGYAAITSPDDWVGCYLGAIPIINHRLSPPEYWSPQSPGQPMQDLPWSPGVTWRDEGNLCRVMRSYKNFLIAMDLQEGAVEQPYALRWSDVADTNGLPPTWDETDPTNLSGKTSLGGDGGRIIDGLTLRDTFVIYRERGITIMDFVGGQFVFNFRHLSTGVGILSPDCIVEAEGIHYILADGDLYAFDGNSLKSLINNRLRSRLLGRVNIDNFPKSYVAHNQAVKEVWFCLPEDDATYPNIAYVYNYEDGTFSLRELPECSHIAYGPKSTPLQSWDSWGEIWDAATGVWGNAIITPQDETLYGVQKAKDDPPGDVADLLVIDRGGNDDGQTFETRLERIDFPLDGHGEVTTITRIYPLMTGTQPVKVQLGSQDHPGAPVRWKSAVDFNPGTDRKVDIRTTGELHCFRISSDGVGSWGFSGFDIEYTPAGRR